MIDQILPPVAVVAETLGEPAGAPLYPAEAAVVRRAVHSRRREFATGRACARRALAQLGVPEAPLLRDPRGAPTWPHGFIGSITHCAGYCGSAVARSVDLASLGIDAEVHAPLPEGVLQLVATPRERRDIRRLSAEVPGVYWDRLLFSIKEAVYKAWYPLTGRWMGFEDVEVFTDPSTTSFRAELGVPGPKLPAGEIRSFAGRWLVTDDLILAASVVAALRVSGEPPRSSSIEPDPPRSEAGHRAQHENRA